MARAQPAKRLRKLPRKRARNHGAEEKDASQELSQDELAKQLDDYSDRISTQVRTVALGVLGLSWLLLVPRQDAHLTVTVPRQALIAITLACILALLAEFCQYLLAEKTVDETFDRAVDSPTGKAAYDAAAFTYRAQFFCYRLKLWLTLGAAGCLVLLLAGSLLGTN